MKKRKIRIDRLLIVIAIPLALIGLISLLFVNFKFIGKSSIHNDAKKYSTRSCMVFYPDGDIGKDYAKTICKENKDNKVFDYVLVPYGDYYLVSYGNCSYYVDKSYNKIVVDEVSDFGKQIIIDYIRYTIKKEKSELYTGEFLENTSVDDFDFTNLTYSIENDSLKCNVPDYDIDVYVPLKYIQNEIGMNFGYTNELYQKPVYIRDNKKVVCLTFNDGPNFKDDSPTSTEKIVETLYKYDVVATFFVIGDNLDDDYWVTSNINAFLLDSIHKGNEYGSRQQTGNVYLTDLTAEKIVQAIEGPANYFKKNLNYEMKLYRPIGMDRNAAVDNVAPYPAVLWNVDSNDLVEGDVDVIYHNVIDDVDNGDIVCLTDIYDDTAEAVEKIVAYLVENDFELVTVSQMMNYYHIENIDYIFDSSYYN